MSFKALPVKIERIAVKKPTEGGGGRGEGHRQESQSSKTLLSLP